MGVGGWGLLTSIRLTLGLQEQRGGLATAPHPAVRREFMSREKGERGPHTPPPPPLSVAALLGLSCFYASAAD